MKYTRRATSKINKRKSREKAVKNRWNKEKMEIARDEIHTEWCENVKWFERGESKERSMAVLWAEENKVLQYVNMI